MLIDLNHEIIYIEVSPEISCVFFISKTIYVLLKIPTFGFTDIGFLAINVIV